jgi:hypothetical protein
LGLSTMTAGAPFVSLNPWSTGDVSW